MASIELTLGNPKGQKSLERRFFDMVTACGPNKAADGLRKFLTREKGVLKRKLSQLIAKEGPLGVLKWYRVRIISFIRGTGLTQTAIIQHDGVDYAAVIEHGRRPGETGPPADELVPWIQKFLKPTDENDEALEEEELLGFAIAMSQNIGEQGLWQPGQQNMRTSASRGPGRQHYARIMFENQKGITLRAFDFFEETIMRCIRGGRGSRR